jgi:predicted  nucleic acid-binding Zn-ribbon protein
MKVTIPVSVGELLDKITILEIKSTFVNNEYVTKELNDLNVIYNNIDIYVTNYLNQLRKINKKLWEIEDRLRKLEEKQQFNEEFIKLARSVYIINDERAMVKKQVNELTNSIYKEIKVY